MRNGLEDISSQGVLEKGEVIWSSNAYTYRCARVSDSAISGQPGINFEAGKSAFDAFHMPNT